jgi:acyl-CoA reductase-like NAD-dependent aldehyde dehydrogenase
MTVMDQSSASSLDVVSPFDGSLIRTLPTSDERDVERMLATASRLFRNRDGWLEHDERLAILERLAKLVDAEADSFAKLIALEGGKPLVDARIEVARAVDGIRLAGKELSHVMRGTEVPMGHTAATRGRIAYTTMEPIGVVVAISAFNHPLNLIVHQVVPAVAVGCPVIVKPASSTPLNCLRFCELLGEAGLPNGWCQPVVCSNSVAETLVTDPRLGFLTFIGSGRVGWKMRSKLAPGVRCALEHGGVAPVIVDETADLDAVIPALTKGGFYHAGQVCVSVQRVFAEESVARQLAERLALAAKELKVGDATHPDTDVGPLIQVSEVSRVHEWVKEAVSGGAQLLCGGEVLSASTYSPTVLFDPPATAKVSTEEVFGPVVCIYPYSDRRSAISRANSLDYAFQAAVFTRDLDRALDTVKRLDAAAVMVNDHTAFRADWMPFGGRRSSGYGVGGIGHSMRDMLQEKMTVVKLTPPE